MRESSQPARFARNPAVFVLWVFAVFITGSLFGFGVNLAVGNPSEPTQDDVSVPPVINPANSGTAELERFDIKTDPHKREVRVQLYSRSGLPSPIVDRSGKRVSITLPNTHLGRSLVENGLPVVADNHNILVGRALPGQDHQAQIVIPSLPNRHYKVVVDVRPAPEHPAAEPQPPVLMLGQADTQNSPVSDNNPDSVPLRPRAGNTGLEPRAVVTPGANSAESIIHLPAMPTVIKPWSKLRPVLNLSPAQTANSNAATVQSLGAQPGGPAIISTEGAYQPGAMVWNPYVSGTQANASGGSTPFPDLTANAPRFTSHQDYPATVSVPRLDPLWYLHQLGGNRPAASGSEPALPPRPDSVSAGSGTATSSVPLVEVPDLTKGVTAAQALAAQNSAAKSGAGSITIDQSFITDIKKALHQIPVWVYALLILFFAGIGLFMLLASLVLLQQLWQQTRLALQQRRARKNAPKPHIPTPQELEALQRARAHQHAIAQALQTDLNLEDTPRLNSLSLLKETPHSVREAVSNAGQAKFAARKMNVRMPVSRTALF